MPQLYARTRSLRRTRWYDEATLDLYERGGGRREQDVLYLAGHVVRLPRGATAAQTVALTAAEVTRLELMALPDEGPRERVQVLPDVTRAVVDRRLGEAVMDSGRTALVHATRER